MFVLFRLLLLCSYKIESVVAARAQQKVECALTSRLPERDKEQMLYELRSSNGSWLIVWKSTFDFIGNDLWIFLLANVCSSSSSSSTGAVTSIRFSLKHKHILSKSNIKIHLWWRTAEKKTPENPQKSIHTRRNTDQNMYSARRIHTLTKYHDQIWWH